MTTLETSIPELARAITENKKFLIISHSNPDGDTIGSNVALREGLLNIGKEVISYCTDALPEKYDIFKDKKIFISDVSGREFDVVITVDVAVPKLIQSDVLTQCGSALTINIDHHRDNSNFAQINIVDDNAPSATMVLFHLFQKMNWKISAEMATGLLLGLYTDTGSFFHSNTSPDSYAVAGDLLRMGANIDSIVRKAFQLFDPKKLQLWGKVLERTTINEEQVVASVVFQEDFEETGTTPQDLEGVVEYLNMVPEGKYALLLTEDGKHAYVKGSLRTRLDDVDVSEIAHQFGGGGHRKASGFKINGFLKEKKVWTVVSDEGHSALSVSSDNQDSK